MLTWNDEALNVALTQAADGVIEAPGVDLTSQQVARLLEAARREPGQPPQFKTVNLRGARLNGPVPLTGATFTEDALFDDAIFRQCAHFEGAKFAGPAAFGRAKFRANAGFNGARFRGDARFDGACFSQDAQFGGATFQRGALFHKVRFKRSADFADAKFHGYAFFTNVVFHAYGFSETIFFRDVDFLQATFCERGGFPDAKFKGNVEFGGATFCNDAHFDRATFAEDVRFGNTTFEWDAVFERAIFERARELGPVRAFDRLWFDGAVFAQRVGIDASALRASFARTVFRGGTDIRLRWAVLWFEDTIFAEPSLVTGLRAPFTREGEKAFLGWDEPSDDGTWRFREEPPEGFAPHVLSVRGAQVSNLTLSTLGLSQCQWAGAHGLDEVRLQRVGLSAPPPGWHTTREGWRVRWTRRRTIAEEHRWRTEQRHDEGWDRHERVPADVSATARDAKSGARARAPWPPQQPEPLDAERIAGLYRQLRKSREDGKDVPGANDFYYGEMEMRRRSGPLAERFIIWLYWLVSGYGLRASRSLVALGITIAVAALALDLWGFRPDRQYGRAVLFALESSISLLRAPAAKLTAGGEVVQVLLRLTGPLFFGLALLALRGRVKR